MMEGMNTVDLSYTLTGRISGVSQSSAERVLDRVDLSWVPPEHPDDTESVSD